MEGDAHLTGTGRSAKEARLRQSTAGLCAYPHGQQTGRESAGSGISVLTEEDERDGDAKIVRFALLFISEHSDRDALAIPQGRLYPLQDGFEVSRRKECVVAGFARSSRNRERTAGFRRFSGGRNRVRRRCRDLDKASVCVGQIGGQCSEAEMDAR